MDWFKLACVLIGMCLLGMIIDPLAAAGFALMFVGSK
jgi:hypothetical protein